MLEELAARFADAGIPVSGSAAEAITDAGPCALLVDEAHLLGDEELDALAAALERPGIHVVVACRAWPRPDALSRLADHLEQPVMLGPLGYEELVDRLRVAFPGAQCEDDALALLELSGGMRWVANAVIASALESAQGSSAVIPVTPRTLDSLGLALSTLRPELHELLLALCIGFDLVGTVPDEVAAAGRIDELVAEAMATGLLLLDGRPIPLVRDAMLQCSPAYHVAALQERLVDSLVANGRPIAEVAEELARLGYRDSRVAAALEEAADAALMNDPALAVGLYDAANAAGASELANAARRAQASLAAGDTEGASRTLDDVLGRDDLPDAARAVDVSAAMWARRGMLARGADIYRWYAEKVTGPSRQIAALCFIGVGDLEAGRAMLTGPPQAPTQFALAMSLVGDGILESVNGDHAKALGALVTASDMMSAAGLAIALPDSPAALAALVALHNGELDVAQALLDDAIAGGQGALYARPRLLLLAAWTQMLAGRPQRARLMIAELALEERSLSPRDELLLAALEVGLARRSDDAQALLAGWQRARAITLHVSFDLFSLLPLGELAIAAARVRDSEWLAPHVSGALEVLASLGEPPAWASSLHWACVQAGILNDKPQDLAPHAAALVRSSDRSRMSRLLADAGREWVAVLAGDFDASAVEIAARDLATVGLAWDGARLAGHAAARSGQRRDVTRLLACARDLNPALETQVEGAASNIQPDRNGFSAREQEVARLLLEGKTYREIGDAMFVSPRTAEHHIAQIRRRLAASTRSDLLARLRAVLDDGLLPD